MPCHVAALFVRIPHARDVNLASRVAEKIPRDMGSGRADLDRTHLAAGIAAWAGSLGGMTPFHAAPPHAAISPAPTSSMPTASRSQPREVRSNWPFKDEAELGAIWSAPDTRARLLPDEIGRVIAGSQRYLYQEAA